MSFWISAHLKCFRLNQTLGILDFCSSKVCLIYLCTGARISHSESLQVLIILTRACSFACEHAPFITPCTRLPRDPTVSHDLPQQSFYLRVNYFPERLIRMESIRLNVVCAQISRVGRRYSRNDYLFKECSRHCVIIFLSQDISEIVISLKNTIVFQRNNYYMKIISLKPM
jgi:hypothetical protein